MDFTTAIGLWPSAPADGYASLFGMLLNRERDAIHSESRLSSVEWHAIFTELDLLTPTIPADEVRLAISAALESAVLSGPPAIPNPALCERAVSFERTAGYFVRELIIPRAEMEDHFDFWSDPGKTGALDACRYLVGHFMTGPRPSWAIPFAAGAPRPLDGHSAGACHQRLALYPDVDPTAKVIMTYALPAGTPQAVPTIGDAFRWMDDYPFWRSFFLPAPAGIRLGKPRPSIQSWMVSPKSSTNLLRLPISSIPCKKDLEPCQKPHCHLSSSGPTTPPSKNSANGSTRASAGGTAVGSKPMTSINCPAT